MLVDHFGNLGAIRTLTTFVRNDYSIFIREMLIRLGHGLAPYICES